jgi:hypothetical protein
MPTTPLHTRLSLTMTRVLLVMFVFALGANGAIAPHPGFAQEHTPLEPTFGPILFSVSGEARPALATHARMATDAGEMQIASGSLAEIQMLREQGASVAVLDPATSGRVYYLADATADGARERAQSVADVLLAGADVLLLGVSLDQEAALLETLPANGVAVALLGTATPGEATTLAPELARLDNSGAALTPANPAVAALLPLLREQDLRTLVDQLSGQTPVTVNGVGVTLTTRHTLAARLRSAEEFVHQWYRTLGIPVNYFAWQYNGYSGRNVVAEVRGRTNPEQILILGGHLDNTSQTPYTLAPGADDNATGTAATLLIAQILRNYAPAITVRFVHFTGEEQGQWGSRVYAAALRQRGERVLGFIDLDMIGYDGNGDRVAEIHTGAGPKSNALGTEFLARNTRYGLGMNFERKTTSASRFSDHSPFWDNDIGAFLVIENFFTDAIPRDRNPYYHNTGDLPSRVDFNYVARIGRVALATLTEMAGYTLGAVPTPTVTPTPTATPRPTTTPTATPTATPGACTNLLVNGDFETNTGWRFGSTPYSAAYVTSPVYSGGRAARLGIPAGVANRLAHSTVYQSVTIPANAATPVLLRFAHRPGGAADGIDYREALLLNTSYGLISRLERSYGAGADQWAVRTFDLSAYRGRTVVLYFNVYNNGAGSQMWNYLDGVHLGSCPTAASTGSDALLVPVDAALERAASMTAPLITAPAHVALTPGADAVVHVGVADAASAVSWDASADVPWLHLAATQGETPGDLRLRVDGAGLAPGVYPAMVTVQDARDETRRATFTVELHVNGLNVYLPAVQR